MSDIFTTTLLILIFFGGPLLPLLMIATEVGRWHEQNQDPPLDEIGEAGH